jgi:hypothetical protein
MTYESEQQVVKAIRSLPWYMFLVPALLSLLMLLFVPSVLNDTRPEYGYWAVMWIVAKLGLFVWVLRQLLRYAIFYWMTKLRRTVDSYSRANTIISSTNRHVWVRPSVSNVTIISRREIPRSQRRCI